MPTDSLPHVRAGTVLSNRFEIDKLAAAGGMGQVFRARDLKSGEAVAVKVLLGEMGGHPRRFEHETQALAELSHPDIVRYVAHGVAASGERYLAMEWLEGEDLANRLQRGAMAIDDAIQLAARVAGALGAAHARDVVHRDLKPSNIFLVRGRIDQVKLLDFGIARLREVTRVTRTGTMVGTPGYMAPEQIRCDRAVDARADVFALGCVLFECLTGMAAFAGEQLMALLAKVVFTEPPRLRALRPEAPEALERLLSRMLAKDPDERPCDGAAVASALARVASQAGAGKALRQTNALSCNELRAISVVLLEGNPAAEIGAAAVDAERTLDAAEAEHAEMLLRGAEACGGQIETLRDGSVVVTIGGPGLLMDQTARAARCALWLREQSGAKAVAVATAPGELAARLAPEAIDRSVGMLVARGPESGAGTGAPVALDEMTARLLDMRFDVREGEAGLTLQGEHEIAAGPRPLLGTAATACVGRDRERSALAHMLEECIAESQPGAALLTGPPGIGKSRLVLELLSGLPQHGRPITVWIGRGDAMRPGSVLGPLGQALRGACGIRGDEPLPERRSKLALRVAQRIGAAEQQRVAAFLGEITGVPFPDEGSKLLRAARANPQIMTGETCRAWVDFLSAECDAQPVLLILEDMHWGDWPTLQFVDRALCDLMAKRWMVLAVARPEAHELFPNLWAGRHIQHIQITRITKRASEQFVRQALGDGARAETAQRLIALAEGNPFYLQELTRTAALQNRGEGLPETIVAMTQSNLATLDAEDRRILRAASVFGEVFWLSGVAALLGAEQATHIQSRLLGLVEQIVRRPESRIAGEVEFAFRHILLREAAHAMLTADDRALGQRLAREWLRSRGEPDPARRA